MKQHLQQNAPGLEVLGSNYPPPPMSLLVARLIGGAQFFVIGVALAGDKLLSPAEHPWAQGILRNKVNACAAAWFLGNMVYQNLMATGAFEVRERPVEPREAQRAPPLLPTSPPVHRAQVFYDGALVFSKLQSGMRPDLGFIVSEVLRRHAGGKF